MPPEITALIAKPHLLVILLAVGAISGMLVERISAKLRRDAWRRPKSAQRPKFRKNAPPPRKWARPESYLNPVVPDSADQLRTVLGAEFSIQPLLNKSETRVFKELDRYVIARNPDWQVMAQVSLGEILYSKDPAAYRCINSKRVDLLLVDGDCKPRHAIEYQGGGHHQGDAAARDAVKKEALRRARIGYHEVVAGHTTPTELRRLVDKLVQSPVSGS